VASIMATVFPIKNIMHEGKHLDFTAVIMTIIRLEKVGTDMMIFINIPHFDGRYSKDKCRLAEKALGPDIELGIKWREEILKTVKIVDWGLFGEEETEVRMEAIAEEPKA
jgi:hypothetical protein